MNPWFALLVAGFCEIGFTTCLKLAEGFRRPWPTAGFLVFSLASFLLLSKSLEKIPLGTAYAVWTGIGAFGTALVGMFFFRDPVTTVRLVLLAVLIGAILGLRLESGS